MSGGSSTKSSTPLFPHQNLFCFYSGAEFVRFLSSVFVLVYLFVRSVIGSVVWLRFVWAVLNLYTLIMIPKNEIFAEAFYGHFVFILLKVFI